MLVKKSGVPSGFEQGFANAAEGGMACWGTAGKKKNTSTQRVQEHTWEGGSQ